MRRGSLLESLGVPPQVGEAARVAAAAVSVGLPRPPVPVVRSPLRIRLVRPAAPMSPAVFVIWIPIIPTALSSVIAVPVSRIRIHRVSSVIGTAAAPAAVAACVGPSR